MLTVFFPVRGVFTVQHFELGAFLSPMVPYKEPMTQSESTSFNKKSLCLQGPFCINLT